MTKANEVYRVKIGRTPENCLVIAIDGGVERLYAEEVFDNVIGALSIAKSVASMSVAPETEPLIFEGYEGREGIIPADRRFIRDIRAHYVQLRGNIARNRENQLKKRKYMSIASLAEAL